MEKLLTINDICEYLQVKRSNVYEWTHIEYIPHYKFPKGIRFKESEIQRWIKQRKIRGRLNYRKSIVI
jgi:excisionase family DNA binding protein